MFRRVAFNGLLFAMLLGGIGGFTRARTGAPDVIDIAMTAALGGVWAGVLVAIVEVKLVSLARVPRLLLSALCGALAYVGLFLAMGMLAGVGVRPELLALGAALGAASHAVRASLAAARAHDDGEDDREDDRKDDRKDDGASR